jgi:hypothetical protein
MMFIIWLGCDGIRHSPTVNLMFVCPLYPSHEVVFFVGWGMGCCSLAVRENVSTHCGGGIREWGVERRDVARERVVVAEGPIAS